MQSKDKLLEKYQKELEFLKKFSKQFAQAHPNIADYLTSNNSYTDPFTDRLIEAIGLLNAKNRLKLDSGFSQICADLLECVAPQSLAPIPAMSVIQLIPNNISSPVTIPAKTLLSSMTPMGEPCYFRTGYDVTCYPINIYSIYSKSTLSIKLESQTSMHLLDKLVFFIRAPENLAYILYELLFKSIIEIKISQNSDDRNPVILDKSCLQTEGFNENQCLIPIHPRSHREHILLSEFFHCPEKFLFLALIT